MPCTKLLQMIESIGQWLINKGWQASLDKRANPLKVFDANIRGNDNRIDLANDIFRFLNNIFSGVGG